MKWKYTTEHVGGTYDFAEQINRTLEKMGDQGWELVSMFRHGKHPRNSNGDQYESVTLYFKQPK
jgi:hypothetical protein